MLLGNRRCVLSQPAVAGHAVREPVVAQSLRINWGTQIVYVKTTKPKIVLKVKDVFIHLVIVTDL